MLKPELYDVIELLVDLPQMDLQSGQLGTILEIHNNNAYEVEFSAPNGEVLGFLALKPEQFVVVWKYQTHEWVPVADRIYAMLEILPEDRQTQVLDFA
ncbi:MAG: DUF4926 domain-containing protein, partial [Synechocystis sp.]|nr:DUF4926 domain-containing protein [Synechocystis sp.]